MNRKREKLCKFWRMEEVCASSMEVCRYPSERQSTMPLEHRRAGWYLAGNAALVRLVSRQALGRQVLAATLDSERRKKKGDPADPHRSS